MLSLLRRLLQILDGRDKRRVAALAALLLVSALLETVGVGVIFPFVRLLNDPSSLHQVPALVQIYGWLGEPGEKVFLQGATFALLALILLKNLLLAGVIHLKAVLTQSLRHAFVVRLFSGYLENPYVFHLGRNSSDLTHNIVFATAQIFGMVLPGFLDLFAEILVIVGISALIILAAPGAALGVLILGTMLFVLLSVAFRRRLVDLGHKTSTYTESNLRTLGHAFGAIKVVMTSGRGGFFVSRLAANDEVLADVAVQVSLFNNLPRLIIEVVMGGALLLASAIILAQDNSPAEVVALLGMAAVAAFRLMPSLGRIALAQNNLRMGMRSVDDIYDDYQAIRRRSRSDVRPKAMVRERLDLDGVCYTYPTGVVPALDKVTLHVTTGESLAVVGSSGAGKTTLVDVMLGLLTPTAGTISVDGTALRAGAETIGGIGYVPQAIYLLDDTLCRNVAFGVDEADIDHDRVRRAVSMAQLDQFVAALPDGLETRVGERGVRLSGGQRQRIGIARALYDDPPILILDEATAALDVETERNFTETLHALAGSKTLVIIAHRLSTVRECSRIALMKDGRVADVAPFDELYRRNADFRRLVDMAELMPTAAIDANSGPEP